MKGEFSLSLTIDSSLLLLLVVVDVVVFYRGKNIYIYVYVCMYVHDLDMPLVFHHFMLSSSARCVDRDNPSADVSLTRVSPDDGYSIFVPSSTSMTAFVL